MKFLNHKGHEAHKGFVKNLFLDPHGFLCVGTFQDFQ
jgi:hypothetical protein